MNLFILKKSFLDYYFSCRIILLNDSLQSQQKTLISVCFEQLSSIHIFKTCFTKFHSVSNVISTWFFANCPSLYDGFQPALCRVLLSAAARFFKRDSKQCLGGSIC